MAQQAPDPASGAGPESNAGPDSNAGPESATGPASSWAIGRDAWKRLPHPIRWITVAVIGVTLVILGLVFMVLPGPGIPLVILGLVVLASEFAWAERTLHRVRRDGGRLWTGVRDRVRRRPGEPASGERPAPETTP